MNTNHPNIDDVSSDAFITIILYASAFLFVLSVGMVLFMVMHRYVLIQRKSTSDILIKKYQNYLAEFIAIPDLETSFITGNQDQETIRLDSKDHKSRFHRDILSNEIYEFHKQLDGHQADQIRQLYLGFSFYELTEQKLKSSNWSDIVRGIDEARQFELRELMPLIKKQLDHKKIDVRCQAIMAMISFEKDIWPTLSTIDYKLTDWERHKILFTMEEQHIPFDYAAFSNGDTSIHSDFLMELDEYLNPEQQLTSVKTKSYA